MRSAEPLIEIPDAVREAYKLWRPTPLFRAHRLERELDTPAHIYYKYEGGSPPGSHKANTAVAQAYVKAAPERLVWGSDWPHPSERTDKPDDALLFDLLAQWAPDEAVRKRILVDNPAKLYGFA